MLFVCSLSVSSLMAMEEKKEELSSLLNKIDTELPGEINAMIANYTLDSTTLYKLKSLYLEQNIQPVELNQKYTLLSSIHMNFKPLKPDEEMSKTIGKPCYSATIYNWDITYSEDKLRLFDKRENKSIIYPRTSRVKKVGEHMWRNFVFLDESNNLNLLNVDNHTNLIIHLNEEAQRFSAHWNPEIDSYFYVVFFKNRFLFIYFDENNLCQHIEAPLPVHEDVHPTTINSSISMQRENDKKHMAVLIRSKGKIIAEYPISECNKAISHLKNHITCDQAVFLKLVAYCHCNKKKIVLDKNNQDVTALIDESWAPELKKALTSVIAEGK